MKRRQKLPLDSGFTIIELLVSISVIGILIGLSYAGYAVFTQRQKLISSGQTLKNILRDIESRSYNGEVDCSVCNCTDPLVNSLDGWFVDLTDKRFYGVCGANSFSDIGLGLSDEIVIASNNNLIQFAGDPPRITDNIIICLSLAGLPNRYYRIEISRGGDISDSAGLIASCTP